VADAAREQALIEKIRDLPMEKLAEVEDFVDFLRQRDEDRHLSWIAAKLSEGVLHKTWDNPDDAEYDRESGL
jgi:hypothetical protein